MNRAFPYINSVLALVIFTLVFRGSASAETNSYWRTIEFPYTAYDSPYRIGLFSPENGEDGARTWSQTKSMFVYGVGVLAVLYSLPENSTGWEHNKDLWSSWQENIKQAPQWDRNKWGYNYVGHAYIGGVYYQVARKSGYRQWDSFLYTTLMSTFYWEFGIEAIAEVPSVQDLVFTPIAGWVVGEWMYQSERKIRSNNNQLLNSTILGNVSLIFLDPIDSIGRGVNRVVGRQWIKSGYGYITYTKQPTPEKTDHTVYLNWTTPIGAAGPQEKPVKLKPEDLIDDPVNTGIIGFGGGMGHTLFDDAWNLEDAPYWKLHLGLYFTPRLSMRLAYAWSDEHKDKTTQEIVEYENYSWDTQVYLFKHKKLRPYLTGGLGRQTWFEDNSTRLFQWNGGIGAHWQLHRKLALNADWINFYSPSRKTHDQQFNAGLTYRFGGGEHQNW